MDFEMSHPRCVDQLYNQKNVLNIKSEHNYIYFHTLVHTTKCFGPVYVNALTHYINPSNAELNPICHLLALLEVNFLHVSRIRVKSLTLRLLMPYIYGAPILNVSRSHTTTHHSR